MLHSDSCEVQVIYRVNKIEKDAQRPLTSQSLQWNTVHLKQQTMHVATLLHQNLRADSWIESKEVFQTTDTGIVLRNSFPPPTISFSKIHKWPVLQALCLKPNQCMSWVWSLQSYVLYFVLNQIPSGKAASLVAGQHKKSAGGQNWDLWNKSTSILNAKKAYACY